MILDVGAVAIMNKLRLRIHVAVAHVRLLVHETIVIVIMAIIMENGVCGGGGTGSVR